MVDEGYRWIGLGKALGGTITLRGDGERRQNRVLRSTMEERNAERKCAN